MQCRYVPRLQLSLYARISCQGTILQAINLLNDKLRESIIGRSWHTAPQYFNCLDGRPAGCLEFSPARHQLGHEVHS